MKAFKHALFGTPRATTPAPASFKQSEKPKETASESIPQSKTSSNRRLQPSDKQTQKDSLSRNVDRPNVSSNELGEDVSLTKPAGILMTPGTISGRRKQVKFGEHIVNNEGKSSKYSKSGLPDNYPGKFPSPFTPKTTTPANKIQKVPSATTDIVTEIKTEGKFKEILASSKEVDAKIQAASRSRDDSDITSDLNLPISSSGRYWKEQYELYSERSEAEMRRLITKHKIAKDYARMKDEEAAVWKSRHDIARNRHEELVSGLEQQIKDFRERLRITSAENAKVKTELALLRKAYEDVATKSNNGESQHASKVKPQIANEEEQKSQAQQLTFSALKDFNEMSPPRDIWLDGEAQRSRPLTRRTGRSELRASQTKSSRQNRMAQKSTSSFDSINSYKADHIGLFQQPSQHKNTFAAPLSEKSPNIVSTPPSRRVKGLATSTKPTTDPTNDPNRFDALGSISHATILQLADTVPLEGLDVQASQPTTPQLAKKSNVKARTPRSMGGSKMEERRMEGAKARIAARRKGKNTTSSRTWV